MQPTLRVQKPAKPLLAITFLVGSIYVLLSLLTYSKEDPSWNYSTSDLTHISNLGGIVGSFLADALLQILGVVSYLITGIVFMMGFQSLRARTLFLAEPAKNQKANPFKIPTAITLFTLCLSSLLSMIPFKIYSQISLGGALGYFASRAGVFCFSAVGASLLFVGGIWAAVVLLQDRFEIPKINFGFLTKLKEIKLFKRTPKPEIKAQPTAKVPLAQKMEELFKKKEAAKTEPEVEAEPPKPSFLPLFKKTEEPTTDRVLLVDKVPAKKKSKTKEAPSHFDLPSLQLLDTNPERAFEISRDELIANSRALEQKLLDFGVQGQVTNIHPGPIITLYEFEPAAGVKVKNILNLTDDLKLAMKAVSIRIIAPIPGRAAVGIEIPNPRRQTVYLREILQSGLFQNSPSPLTLGMGKTTSGDPYVTDLAKMPHLLIAGATGSGKSVGLNSMIISLLYKATPDELKFIMIDPKMLELSVYEGIPHLLLPVVTDPKKAARALGWAVKEMERRYKLISSLGARNLKSYNEKVARLSEAELKQELEKAAQTEEATSALIEDEAASAEKTQKELALEEAGLDHYVKLPNIVVVIDELADLMVTVGKEVEVLIQRLSQKSRAAGIHLIMATQRPSVDVITGVIKANLPTRISFAVTSRIDSRTILGEQGAEQLLGKGDMLYKPNTDPIRRVHGPFVSDEEVERIADYWRGQGSPEYVDSVTEEPEEGSFGFDDLDATASDSPEERKYRQACQIVFESQKASASWLQRQLGVGYNTAAKWVERMEADGFVGPANHVGRRDIYRDKDGSPL